jgi:hypothetical protein
LVCWDYDRWKSIIFAKTKNSSSLFKYQLIWLPILFGLGAVFAYVVLAFYILQTIKTINFSFLLLLAGFGIFFGLAVSLHHKFMRIGVVEK